MRIIKLMSNHLSEACSCWSAFSFVWLSVYHQETKQQRRGRPQGDWRAIRPRLLNWDSKYCVDSLNAFLLCMHFFLISIYPCVRACPAAVMSSCAHNRQLLVHLFCRGKAFDFCAPLLYSILKNTIGARDGGQDHRGPFFCLETDFQTRSIPSSNPWFPHF